MTTKEKEWLEKMTLLTAADEYTDSRTRSTDTPEVMHKVYKAFIAGARWQIKINSKNENERKKLS